MARKGSKRADNTRRLVAHEAARIMSEQGIDDFYLAKRKAAQRLGVTDQASLPRNSEIESAIVENQRIFNVERHAARVAEYRQEALNAMRFFSQFDPRVVGAVLSGVVSEGTDLELHFFTDTPEHVSMRLEEEDIPYRLVDRRVRMPGNGHVRFPGYRFVAGTVPILVLVFPLDGIRQAPSSPVDGRPMRRADLRDLEALIS